MNNVVFIDGIPGSGKTTLAKKLYDYLRSINKKVELYQEGDLHPIDLAWCAILKENEYQNLTSKYQKYLNQINDNMRKVKDNYIIAYTKIRVEDEDSKLYDDFSKYEIYRTNNLKTFKEAHIDLWTNFNDSFDKDTIYIFECVFLQNHINELILKHNLSDDKIITYFKDLEQTIKDTNPLMIYLDPTDVDYTVNRVIKERKTDKPEIYKDWIDLVIEYFNNTKYGKQKGYNTLSGVMRYFKDRINLEKEVLKNLNISNISINVKDDYDQVFEEIKKAVTVK